MKTIRLFQIVTAIVLFAGLTVGSHQQSFGQKKEIVGYLADYQKSYFNSVDFTKLDKVCFAFVNPSKTTGDFGLDIGPDLNGNFNTSMSKSELPALLQIIRTANPNIKILVSIGGAAANGTYGYGNKYATILGSSSTRYYLADKIVEFVNTYGFDGVDVDLEYKAMGHGNTTLQAAFTSFMLDLSSKLGSNKLFTAAFEVGQSNVMGNIVKDNVLRELDWVYSMSYSPFETFSSARNYWTSRLNTACGNNSKLVMGVDFNIWSNSVIRDYTNSILTSSGSASGIMIWSLAQADGSEKLNTIYSILRPGDPYEGNNSSSAAKSITTSFNNNLLTLTTGDEDWFKFTYSNQTYYVRVKGYNSSTTGAYGLKINMSGSIVNIETYQVGGSTDTYLYLYNSSMTELAQNDDYTGYFSKLSKDLGGSSSDPYEANNSSSQAKTVSTSLNENRTSLTAGDEDWFKFTYSGRTYYVRVKGYNSSTQGAYGLRISMSGSYVTVETFAVSGSTDTYLYLYNSSLGLIASNDDYSGLFSRVQVNLSQYKSAEITTNVEDFSEIHEMSVFPNPAIDVVNITMNEPFRRISITDISGRIIKTVDNLDANKIGIEVADIPVGTYIFFVETNKGNRLSRKVIVNH